MVEILQYLAIMNQMVELLDKCLEFQEYNAKIKYNFIYKEIYKTRKYLKLRYYT